MKHSLKLALAPLAALVLAACATGTQAPAPQQPASPIPNFDFSPDVSDTAITACRNALDAQTDCNIDVVVYMTVSSNRAPWKCFTANDGRYANTEFTGSEGAL